MSDKFYFFWQNINQRIHCSFGKTSMNKHICSLLALGSYTVLGACAVCESAGAICLQSMHKKGAKQTSAKF